MAAGPGRLDGWEERLWRVLELGQALPFSHGPDGLDCARFSALAVEAVTGSRPKLPRYGTDAGVLRVARRGIPELVAKALEGAEEVPVGLARRGDVALLPSGEEGLEHALGVVVGAHVATVGPEGFFLAPLAEVSKAWRVG